MNRINGVLLFLIAVLAYAFAVLALADETPPESPCSRDEPSSSCYFEK